MLEYCGVASRETKASIKKDRQAEISLAVFLLYAASVSSLIRVIPLKSDPFSKVFRGITLKTSFELSIFGSW